MENEDPYMKALSGKCECCLLDLDDTMYPYSTGMASECGKNIQKYMIEKLKIEESKVPNLCSLLYKKYGTTMAGLQTIGYNFNYDDYHSSVHGTLPYDNLKPDLVLRQILLSLPIRKVIFTNADKKHADEAIERLGLENCFDEIICFETLNQKKSTSDEPKTQIICKPQIDAMMLAVEHAKINPHKTAFFDDSIRNIQSGKRIGLRTVLVGHSQKVEGADCAIESIHNIRTALLELWGEAEEPEDVRHAGNVALETPVTA